MKSKKVISSLRNQKSGAVNIKSSTANNQHQVINNKRQATSAVACRSSQNIAQSSHASIQLPQNAFSAKFNSSIPQAAISGDTSDKSHTQTNNNNNNKLNTFTYICSGCNKPIKRDRYLLKACEKYWHENCLRCDRCHSRLGELGSSLYFKSNMNLCRQDYLELFGETGVCSLCEKIICASEMVMRAKENVYHLECFACQLCSQRFCVGDRFYLWENKVVCQFDYEEHILPIQNSLQLELLNSSSLTEQQTSLTDNHLSTPTIASAAQANSNSLIKQEQELDYRNSCASQIGDSLLENNSTNTKDSHDNKQPGSKCLTPTNTQHLYNKNQNSNQAQQQTQPQRSQQAKRTQSPNLMIDGDDEMRQKLVDLSNSSSIKKQDEIFSTAKAKDTKLDQASLSINSLSSNSTDDERKEDKVLN